ncbi:toprim domain-containing protein [Phenylobacterium sp. LH3H17]|uniref:DUF7146 domain-containing protein n=1 Tax=Phenylobacterium sp. LH3H17 TaxID=2903901 RepID=UPI0020C9B4EA|nr:toprim domain-containing protein [Phenylobacterium sp. LH3H17]UTP38170.1 toprim domain-containing protein [Phenylobacterium sp. LH3H17]
MSRPSLPFRSAGLRAIVAALGGDLYDGGRRANIPAPGHSAHDRSVSLLLDGGRVVVHSFGAATWREVLDDLRGRGLIDDCGGLGGGPAPGRDAASARGCVDRREAVRRLWDGAVTIGPGSVAARHARRRGVARPLAPIAALRVHPAAPVRVYDPGPAVRPALLAAVRAPDDSLTALEITYLDAQGRRAADLALSRKTVGRIPPGSAVRLDPAGDHLLVAEGVFSALSAGARFGLPAWALLSTSNLRRWIAPAGVRRVLVAADRGRDGEASAARLAGALRRAGVAVEVATPPEPFGDWNEMATAGGGRKGG